MHCTSQQILSDRRMGLFEHQTCRAIVRRFHIANAIGIKFDKAEQVLRGMGWVSGLDQCFRQETRQLTHQNPIGKSLRDFQG